MPIRGTSPPPPPPNYVILESSLMIFFPDDNNETYRRRYKKMISTFVTCKFIFYGKDGITVKEESSDLHNVRFGKIGLQKVRKKWRFEKFVFRKFVSNPFLILKKNVKSSDDTRHTPPAKSSFWSNFGKNAELLLPNFPPLRYVF